MPKTRKAFWRNKLSSNVARDEQATRALRSQGWRVLVVWECELKRGDKHLEAVLAKATSERRMRG